MSSSTSNSESSAAASSRHEWKVILAVMLAIAACEVAMRTQSAQYSEAQHRLHLSKAGAELSADTSPRLLFLGNSLTELGVNVDAFRDQLAIQGMHAGGIAKAHPQATAISQWRTVYQGYFGAHDPPPDCVVVTFVWEHLSDQSGSRARLTAKLVNSIPIWLDVLQHDVDSFDDGADLTVACLLQTVAYQENAKHRLMAEFVPQYQKERQRLNSLRLSAAPAQRKKARNKPSLTYNRLNRFIAVLKETGCRGVFCMMPVPEPQVLDERLVDELESASMTFIDMRYLYERTQSHYPDGYHMDAVGADIYSRAVADELAKRMPDLWQSIK